jgi:hypothetical protein
MARMAATSASDKPGLKCSDEAPLLPVAVAEGELSAACVPLSCSASAWKAAKLRGLLSSLLIAKTIPDPQWLSGFV